MLYKSDMNPTSSDSSTIDSSANHNNSTNSDSAYPLSTTSAIELFSRRFRGRTRTFFVDLKESPNGKFLKISEKSNGQKHTILMDIEDLPELVAALDAIKALL